MIRTLRDPTGAIEWIDVVRPTETELGELAIRFGLPLNAVHDCLDSTHLPKFERLANADFIIVRHADDEALRKPDADTVQELTRKIALFVGRGFLLTIHRTDPPFLRARFEKYAESVLTLEKLSTISLEIMRCAMSSYEGPLELVQEAVDSFELHIFSQLADALALEAMYFVKRKISVYRRMLRQTLDVIQRIPPEDRADPVWQSVRERGERLFVTAEDLGEEIRNLLSTHISLASHRTNEIMRVLTIFSAFFLPLTFIAGVYGMNFTNMPELRWRWGYAFAWSVMGFTGGAIFLWFRRKGWLR